VPARSVRALEWDRGDLLGSSDDVDPIARRYAEFLGLDAGTPTAEAADVADVAPSPRRPRRGVWVLLLAGLAPPLVLGLVYVLGEVLSGVRDGEGDGLSFGGSLLSLGLVLLSSLLLVGAVLPPALIARTGVSPASFARYRQPLALAAIGLLVSVSVFTLLVELA
jgi:hypothetical protein